MSGLYFDGVLGLMQYVIEEPFGFFSMWLLYTQSIQVLHWGQDILQQACSATEVKQHPACESKAENKWGLQRATHVFCSALDYRRMHSLGKAANYTLYRLQPTILPRSLHAAAEVQGTCPSCTQPERPEA